MRCETACPTLEKNIYEALVDESGEAYVGVCFFGGASQPFFVEDLDLDLNLLLHWFSKVVGRLVEAGVILLHLWSPPSCTHKLHFPP